MASAAEKEKEGDKLMRKAEKKINISITRWKPDWEGALPDFDKAATIFKVGKHHEKAKNAFQKLSMCHEKCDSPWDAAKHMESAGAAAAEQGVWHEVVELYSRAAELFVEALRPERAAETYFKAGKVLETPDPDAAIKMYLDACEVYETEDREHSAGDAFRSAAGVCLKQKRYGDAAAILLRYGLACDKIKAGSSQCKAYLSAVIVWLYAGDLAQAEMVYRDCFSVDVFNTSEEGRVATQLLDLYHAGKADAIQKFVKENHTFTFLDMQIVRLVKQLPTGDVVEMAAKAKAKGLGNNVQDLNDTAGLDENDLT
eukprot:jgi/Mesvir1/14384/Mv09781-RA.1